MTVLSPPSARPLSPAPTAESELPSHDQASGLRRIVATYREAPQSHTVMLPRPAPVGQPAASQFYAPPTPGAAALPTRRVPVVAIAAGKGGVGKTTIAVGVCAVLAQAQVRVTLVDADLGLANADLLAGISPARRLDSVLSLPTHRRTLASITQETPAGFRLVPGSVGIARVANLPPAERIALLNLLLSVEEDADLIALDTGAGLHENVLAFLRYADLSLFVVTPDPASIADAYATLKLFHATRSPARPARIGVVVNQAESDEQARAVFARIEQTAKRFLGIAPALLGVIRTDRAVVDAVRARTPVPLHAPSALATHGLHALSQATANALSVRLKRPLHAPPAPRASLLHRLLRRPARRTP